MTTIQYDKSNDVFTVQTGSDEMILIAKLLGLVRLGDGSRAKAAAFNLLTAIEQFDAEIFDIAEDKIALSVTVEGSYGEIAATINGESAVIELTDAESADA